METIKQVLSRDETFRYQLLSRLKMDCEYYLGNGQRLSKHLWALDVGEQVKYMKELWSSFPDNGKPEWLTYEEILKYERKMKEA